MQLENQPEVAKIANQGDSNIAVAARDAHTTQNSEPVPAPSPEVASAKPGALATVKHIATGVKNVNQAIEPLKTGKEAANTGNDLYNTSLQAVDNIVTAANPIDLSAAAPKGVAQI